MFRSSPFPLRPFHTHSHAVFPTRAYINSSPFPTHDRLSLHCPLPTVNSSPTHGRSLHLTVSPSILRLLRPPPAVNPTTTHGRSLHPPTVYHPSPTIGPSTVNHLRFIPSPQFTPSPHTVGPPAHLRSVTHHLRSIPPLLTASRASSTPHQRSVGHSPPTIPPPLATTHPLH